VGLGHSDRMGLKSALSLSQSPAAWKKTQSPRTGTTLKKPPPEERQERKTLGQLGDAQTGIFGVATVEIVRVVQA